MTLLNSAIFFRKPQAQSLRGKASRYILFRRTWVLKYVPPALIKGHFAKRPANIEFATLRVFDGIRTQFLELPDTTAIPAPMPPEGLDSDRIQSLNAPMISLKSWGQLLFLTLKKNILLLWLLQILSTLADQKITREIERHLSSSEKSPELWFFIPSSILLNLWFPTLITLLVLFEAWKRRTDQAQSRSLYLKNNLGYSLKETLRVWGKTLGWSLLFLLPGLYKILEFSLVPFIVVFHPNYHKGSVDALSTCAQLAKGRRWKIAVVLAFSVLIFPVFFSQFDKIRHFETHPITASLFCLIEVIVSTGLVLSLFGIFERSLRESHISMERYQEPQPGLNL